MAKQSASETPHIHRLYLNLHLVYMQWLSGGWIRDWMSKKHEEYWHPVCGQKEATGFLKQLSAKKKAGQLINLSRNQLYK